MSRFGLDIDQANAILEMQLRRLTGLEQDKIKNEYDELLKKIQEYEGILADRQKVLDIIKAELLEETGFIADEIEIVTKNVSSSAGCTSEVVTIAIARINNPILHQEPVNDGGIIVDRILVNKKDIPQFLKKEQDEGNTIAAHTLAGLYYIK